VLILTVDSGDKKGRLKMEETKMEDGRRNTEGQVPTQAPVEQVEENKGTQGAIETEKTNETSETAKPQKPAKLFDGTVLPANGGEVKKD
jgi:hypothetical protein